MKKTINVNIGGSAFTMDDDAHTALTFYLTQINARLSPSERTEVMEDVEMRIGSLLAERLPGTYRVVDYSLVNEIMQIMGPASEFGDEPQRSAPSGSSSSTNSTRRPTEKSDSRFYRSRSSRVFGGLLGALAPRMGVDVVLLRVLAILFGGALFWPYIICWIIIPEEPTKPFNINKEQ